ncbi:PQQ-binding-like beta-propeller repeat protein [Natrialbaceae archaeon A-CW1-1]
MSESDDRGGDLEAHAHRQRPTKFDQGVTLTRRQAMQAAAAAMATAAISSGSVAADVDEVISGVVDGLKETIPGSAKELYLTTTPVGLAVYVGAVGTDLLEDALNEDPTADRHSLHQLTHNEISWQNAHLATFGNHMEDTRPVASLEARHGIASAWEAGEGSSSAHDIAHQRIRQFYALPEFNHLHVMNKALLQLMYIAKSGDKTDPKYAYYASGERVSDSEPVQFQFNVEGDTEQIEFELHDGTAIDETAFDNVDHIDGPSGEGVLHAPVLRIMEPDNPDNVHATSPITQDVLDSFDAEEQEFTFEVDGEQYTTSLRLISDSVDGDDESTHNQRAFDGPEYAEQWHDVKNLSDDVVTWYTHEFVQDIYAELDAGTITPEQVRSPEGMARFLSGTDDPTSERFRISWMQQFGLERADMTLVRGMSVNWSGATDTVIDSTTEAPYQRWTHPGRFVDDETYNGVVFGSDLPEKGFQSGNRYMVGPTLYSVGNDRLEALDPYTKEVLWKREYGDNLYTCDATDDGRYIVTGDWDGDVIPVDVSDGSSKWVDSDHNNRIQDVIVSDDRETVYSSSSGVTVRANDFEDGSERWTYTFGDSTDSALAESPSGEKLVIGSSNEIHIIDVQTQNELVSINPSVDVGYGAAWSPSGETIYTTGIGDALLFHDAETGDELENISLPDVGNEVIVDSEGDIYVAFGHPASGNDGVKKFTPDGTEVWHYDQFNGSPRTIELSADEQTLYASHTGEYYALSPDDGSLQEQSSIPEFGQYELATPQPPVDGTAARTIIFDEGTDDLSGDGQVDLWNGVIEINEMWDAGGATITHVDDETIEDIEALESTPDEIETVVDEMDEFDSVDDIKYTRHVFDILEFYDVEATVGEGEENDIVVQEVDYNSPDYDSFDSSEFAEAMAELEELIEQLEEQQEDDDNGDGDDSIGWPSFGFGDYDLGGSLVGLGIIAGAVVLVFSIVTDALPWTR